MTGWLSRKTKARLALGGLAIVCAAPLGCGSAMLQGSSSNPDPGQARRVRVSARARGGLRRRRRQRHRYEPETVRLLRSQLRSKSELRVIDADVMQLVDVAQEQNKAAANDARG